MCHCWSSSPWKWQLLLQPSRGKPAQKKTAINACDIQYSRYRLIGSNDITQYFIQAVKSHHQCSSNRLSFPSRWLVHLSMFKPLSYPQPSLHRKTKWWKKEHRMKPINPESLRRVLCPSEEREKSNTHTYLQKKSSTPPLPHPSLSLDGRDEEARLRERAITKTKKRIA